MPKVMVTGGMGYIGSHTIVDLLSKGFEVFSIDNYSNSSLAVLDQIEAITHQKVINYPIDLCDENALAGVLEKEKNIDGIIHFAAYKAVGESVAEPLKYFQNNIISLLRIIAACRDHNIPNLIYSSSCTVYGSPDQLPVTEQTPIKEAESPYGMTKQMGEEMIRASISSLEMSAIILRYFNPAGAHESGLMGESPTNIAQNLVPIITETAIGKRTQLNVFGDDYPTRDGSCIRDYIHVMDLAEAHTLAMQRLLNNKGSGLLDTYNLGTEKGVTVLEAIHAFEDVSGVALNYVITDRRPGDIAAIYADASKAKEILQWTPKRNISDIMATAWAWEQVRN